MRKVLLMLGCVVALGGSSNLVAMDLYNIAVDAQKNGALVSADVALPAKKQLIANWLDTHEILDRVNDVAVPASTRAQWAAANALRGKAAKLRTVKDDIYAYVYENKALDFNPATADSFANKIEVYVTDLNSGNAGGAAASAEANLVNRVLLHADHTGPNPNENLPIAVGGTALNTVTEASEFLKVFLNGSWDDTALNHIPTNAATRKDESLHAAQILCHFGHDGQFNGHKLNGTYDLDDLVFAITKALFQR